MDMEKQEKEQRWYLRIQEYAESGLSQKSWCKSQGIPASTFGYWYRKYSKHIKKEHANGSFFQIGTADDFFSAFDPTTSLPRKGRESKIASSFADFSQSVRITYGEFSIELPLNLDPTMLLTLLRVMKSV